MLISSASPDIGRQLLRIDTALRERLSVSSDAVIRRMLERAGSRIRSRARGNHGLLSSLASVPNERAATVLGPAQVAELGLETDQLLEGSFGSFSQQFDDWASRAGDQALKLAGLQDDEALRSRLHEARGEALDWLVAALLALASQRLYDPSPDAPEFGEFDPSVIVPVGILREALARAGGALPETLGQALLLDGGTRPVGGIATGDVIMGGLQDAGGGVEGWEWVYGDFPRMREFEPHKNLDGLRFTSWTDERLRNDSGWPEVSSYLPGDHVGCLCDFSPILVMPEEAAA